jgi:acyl-coenzyme A thioesterase 13
MSAANTTKAAVVKLMKFVISHNATSSIPFDAAHKFPACSCFNSVLQKVKFVDGDIGRCIASLKIEQEHCNYYGTLHGGCTATLVDVISTFALVDDTEESLKQLGVTVNMNIDYMKAGRLDSEIIIDAQLKKRGKKLAFLDVEIRDKESNDLLAKGSHTKFIGQ